MRKVLFAIGMLVACASASASITTSIDGGTSYIHLGKMSAKECTDFLASPASASLKVALDGKIRSPGDGKCHDGIKVDIVATDPVTKVTATEITTWPLAKEDCMKLAVSQVTKGTTIRVNGTSVSKNDAIASACSKSSNAISVPR